MASLAEDGSQLQCLLGKIRLALHGSSLEQLPDRDQRIGPYHYNATERARGLSQVYTQLQGMCNVSCGRQGLFGPGRASMPLHDRINAH